MDNTKAQRQAEKLWGDSAFAVTNDDPYNPHFAVGVLLPFNPKLILQHRKRMRLTPKGNIIELRGTGCSWESAFENAKKNINN